MRTNAKWMAQLSAPVLAGRSGGRKVSAQARQGFGLLNASSLLPQGPLVSGVKTGWRAAWRTMMQELAPQDAQGGYQRPSYAFGSKIGDPTFPVEANRYHLYVGNACPWCHRVLLALAILGLDRYITFTWLLDDAERASRGGWIFDPSTGTDPVFGAKDLKQVYETVSPGFSGRCTAPLLVDKRQGKAVCNESGIMLDMLYEMASNLEDCAPYDLKPEPMAAQIDDMNDFVYNNINNAVYRSGFATEQAGYDRAQADLEAGLQRVETILTQHPFLMGDKFTDADLRLFPTAVRYDAVYNGLFRCTRRRIAGDCPHLHQWMQRIWQLPGHAGLNVSDTYSVAAAQKSYYGQLFPLNPSGIIPQGPTAEDLGLERPTNSADGTAADVFFRLQSAVPA